MDQSRIDRTGGELSPMFFVGRDGEGHWIVRDARGLTGGLFVDRASALHYAAFESDHRPHAVLLLPETIELSLSGSLPRF